MKNFFPRTFSLLFGTLMLAGACAVAQPPATETTATTATAWTEAAPGVRWRELSPGRGRSPQRGDKVFMHISTYLDDGPLFHTTRGSRMPVGYFYGDGQMPAAFDAAIATMKEQGRREIEFAPEAEYRTTAHLSEGDQFSTSALVRLDVVLLWVEPALGGANAATSTGKGGETP
ncbi:MAG: FKBP-type peptidyl-prolyl cis-trans isomerase [Candidatus Sumerlaeaceae bacterium]|nr:FKBP-type peptidyl-prolyl cis-trans isomerase [Candidatus Sumerlaeaceae bacterium]